MRHDEASAWQRLEQHAQEWSVHAEAVRETASSLLAFGQRDAERVVLKVIKQRGDEWESGTVLRAFAGRGMVRLLEQVGGAVLLERLEPATALSNLVLAGRDDEAIAIIADVIQQMPACHEALERFATPEDLGVAFERYVASGDRHVAVHLVDQAADQYNQLCQSQQRRRLLHGDLQHYNVLFDSNRGWVAIDPKGVAAELEFELGAALRNPVERPELFTAARTIERRVASYSTRLSLDPYRILAWSFAQAVLSAIWLIEDDALDALSPTIRLAEAIRLMM